MRNGAVGDTYTQDTAVEAGPGLHILHLNLQPQEPTNEAACLRGGWDAKQIVGEAY